MGKQKRSDEDADLALAGSGVEEVWHPAPPPDGFDETMTPLDKVHKGLEEMRQVVNNLVELGALRGDALTLPLLQKYSGLNSSVWRWAREAAGETE